MSITATVGEKDIEEGWAEIEVEIPDFFRFMQDAEKIPLAGKPDSSKMNFEVERRGNDLLVFFTVGSDTMED